MAYFDDLFTYDTSKGFIIPDTGEVKAKIENAFKQIFGGDFDLSPTTPMGRLVEALTMMFVNIIGVNASNAGGLDPDKAVGNWLNLIGSIFGINRLFGESDEEYRKRILSSQSRGSGFAQSIWNAVGNVNGVTALCVIENGLADPKVVLPNSKTVVPDSSYGIAIDPHSVFVCVNGGNDLDIARAIFRSKSAGCAYHVETDPSADPIDVSVADDTGVSSTVRFYRPTERFVRFAVSIRGDAYTGTDIVSDTKSVLTKYMANRDSNHFITKDDLITAIGSSGLGVVCLEVTIETSDDQGVDKVFSPVNQLVILPYQFVSVTNESTTVTVL